MSSDHWSGKNLGDLPEADLAQIQASQDLSVLSGERRPHTRFPRNWVMLGLAIRSALLHRGVTEAGCATLASKLLRRSHEAFTGDGHSLLWELRVDDPKLDHEDRPNRWTAAADATIIGTFITLHRDPWDALRALATLNEWKWRAITEVCNQVLEFSEQTQGQPQGHIWDTLLTPDGYLARPWTTPGVTTQDAAGTENEDQERFRQWSLELEATLSELESPPAADRRADPGSPAHPRVTALRERQTRTSLALAVSLTHPESRGVCARWNRLGVTVQLGQACAPETQDGPETQDAQLHIEPNWRWCTPNDMTLWELEHVEVSGTHLHARLRTHAANCGVLGPAVIRLSLSQESETTTGSGPAETFQVTVKVSRPGAWLPELSEEEWRERDLRNLATDMLGKLLRAGPERWQQAERHFVDAVRSSLPAYPHLALEKMQPGEPMGLISSAQIKRHKVWLRYAWEVENGKRLAPEAEDPDAPLPF